MALTTTFKDWILKSDVISRELIDYVEKDNNFPQTSIRQDMLSYLKLKQASTNVIENFKLVYDEYRVFRKRECMIR